MTASALGQTRDLASRDPSANAPLYCTGFETGCPDWKLSDLGDPNVRFATDPGVCHAGKSSLRFELNGTNTFWLCRTFKGQCTPGNTYTFRGHIKLENVDGEVGFCTDMGVDEPRFGPIDAHKTLTGTHDWTEVAFDIGVPPNVTVVCIDIVHTAKDEKPATAGTFWVDDVSLTWKAKNDLRPFPG